MSKDKLREFNRIMEEIQTAIDSYIRNIKFTPPTEQESIDLLAEIERAQIKEQSGKESNEK